MAQMGIGKKLNIYEVGEVKRTMKKFAAIYLSITKGVDNFFARLLWYCVMTAFIVILCLTFLS